MVTLKPKNRLIHRVAAIVAVLISSSAAACAAGEKAMELTHLQLLPLSLYKNAWQTVNDNYYDKTFNGQDWSRWKSKYDFVIHDLDDANLAIETMIASLGDNESRFLPREQFDDERSQIEARFFGVGLHLGRTDTGALEIRAPIPRTPAFRAGLQTGDRIVAIDHVAAPLSTPEAVKRIRGPQNTRVTLTIRRGAKRRDYTITRDYIPVYCVFDSRMIDKNVGYIRVDSWVTAKSLDDIVENLSKLKSARGIILDLRGVHGGLMSTTLDFASLFIADGLIVSEIDRNGETKTAFRVDAHRKRNAGSGSTLPLFGQSLVVLTDGSTSGSAQVLVGALKDRHRAVIVGEKTRGRGNVVSIIRLPNGAGLSFPTLRYVTPLNAEVMSGIVPDHVVAVSDEDRFAGRGPWYLDGRGENVNRGRSPADGSDVQLLTACKIMRERLDKSYGLSPNL